MDRNEDGRNKFETNENIKICEVCAKNIPDDQKAIREDGAVVCDSCEHAHVCGKSEDVCEECCEHGDTDDYECLICGKELLEDRIARAYDMAKDRIKYGE